MAFGLQANPPYFNSNWLIYLLIIKLFIFCIISYSTLWLFLNRAMNEMTAGESFCASASEKLISDHFCRMDRQRQSPSLLSGFYWLGCTSMIRRSWIESRRKAFFHMYTKLNISDDEFDVKLKVETSTIFDQPMSELGTFGIFEFFQ